MTKSTCVREKGVAMGRWANRVFSPAQLSVVGARDGGASRRVYPKNRYVTPIAASTPTNSPNSAQPSAWRVFFTPTEPKYTAST